MGYPEGLVLSESFSPKRPKLPEGLVLSNDTLPPDTTEITIGKSQPVDMSTEIPSEILRFTDNDIPFTGGLLKVGDIPRGIGQSIGAAGGALGGGALTGGMGAVPGFILGGGAGNVAGNKFNDLVDAVAAKFRGLPQPGLRGDYGEQIMEGAGGAVLDKALGPLFQAGSSAARGVKEAIEPYASKVGESRFAKGLKSTTGFGKSQFDLNKLDPDAGDMGGNLVKVFAPNMGEFDFKDQVDIVERLYDAESSGYFSNISSLNEARKKVKEDIGYKTIVKDKTPDGRTYSREKLQPGRLQIAEESAAKRIAEKQDEILNNAGIDSAGRNIATGFNEVQDIIANRFQQFISKKKDYYQPEEVASVYEELLLPKLANQIKLNESGQLSFKNIHEIRKVWDDIADDTFRNNIGGSAYTTKSGLTVDPALKGNLEKEIANALRELEESVAEKIDPVLYSDFKIAKSELRAARNLSDVLTKSAVREMKANSGIGNSVVRLKKPTVWDALNKFMGLPGTPEQQMFTRAQASSKLRGNPVNATFNTSDMSKIAAFDNMIAPSRLATGGFEAGAEVAEKALNPLTADVVSAAGARQAPELVQGGLQGIMPNQQGVVPQASPTPYASLTPQNINQAMQATQPQMTPVPVSRNTVSIQQNPDNFLIQLAEAASKPRMPEEQQLPPEVLHNRAYKMVQDIQQILKTGNNAMIAETMQNVSRMFPEIFEPGLASQWDGMISDPAERGYFLKDLNIKRERGEVSKSFHARQVSEMNEYGKILQVPPPQPNPIPQTQPKPRIQTSLGAMRQPAY